MNDVFCELSNYIFIINSIVVQLFLFTYNGYFISFNKDVIKPGKLSMKKITKLLQSRKILISDGAWGTFLYNKGLQAGECPELWNETHESEVFEIAKSYVDAGSDIIETNSFGRSRIKLKHYGLEEKTYDLNKKAAQISRKKVERDSICSRGDIWLFLYKGCI